jgi:hypothetical protein
MKTLFLIINTVREKAKGKTSDKMNVVRVKTKVVKPL